MSTVGTPVVRCGGCGKAAAWNPEYAGRRVRCKCGHVIDIEKQPAIAGAARMTPSSMTPADPP